MRPDFSFLRGLASCALAALASLMLTPAVHAQNADGEAQAVIVSPLSLVKSKDLEFGTLIAGATGGTAVISTQGVRSVTGSVVQAGGLTQNAEFWGAGTAGRYVYIYSAPGVYTLNRVGGGATVTLRSLTVQANNLTPRFFPGLFQINTNAAIQLRIGGTIDILPNQQQGQYSGTFPLTMNYY